MLYIYIYVWKIMNWKKWKIFFLLGGSVMCLKKISRNFRLSDVKAWNFLCKIIYEISMNRFLKTFLRFLGRILFTYKLLACSIVCLYHFCLPSKREWIEMNWNRFRFSEILIHECSNECFSILNAFLFIYRNCMEPISMPFNLKIILAFSLLCEYCLIQNFE